MFVVGSEAASVCDWVEWHGPTVCPHTLHPLAIFAAVHAVYKEASEAFTSGAMKDEVRRTLCQGLYGGTWSQLHVYKMMHART